MRGPLRFRAGGRIIEPLPLGGSPPLGGGQNPIVPAAGGIPSASQRGAVEVAQTWARWITPAA